MIFLVLSSWYLCAVTSQTSPKSRQQGDSSGFINNQGVWATSSVCPQKKEDFFFFFCGFFWRKMQKSASSGAPWSQWVAQGRLCRADGFHSPNRLRWKRISGSSWFQFSFCLFLYLFALYKNSKILHRLMRGDKVSFRKMSKKKGFGIHLFLFSKFTAFI